MGGNRKRTADTADAAKADPKYVNVILITPAPVETFPSLEDRGLWTDAVQSYLIHIPKIPQRLISMKIKRKPVGLPVGREDGGHDLLKLGVG